MANVIIVLILVAAVGYGIYSFIHHLRHGGGCCGEHDAPAKKVRAADTNKSHYPHRLVMGVDGMTCQNCQRHVENALNVMPGTWAAVDLAAHPARHAGRGEPERPERDGLDEGRRRRGGHPQGHPRRRLPAAAHEGKGVIFRVCPGLYRTM